MFVFSVFFLKICAVFESIVFCLCCVRFCLYFVVAVVLRVELIVGCWGMFLFVCFSLTFFKFECCVCRSYFDYFRDVFISRCVLSLVLRISALS